MMSTPRASNWSARLDLFFGIELTARNLFAVAEGGVENEDFLVRHMDYLKLFEIRLRG